MSLLHQETPDQIDDAARGEELTKGSTHLIRAGIVAAVLVSIAIAIYVTTNEKKPPATGAILDVWVHPLHTFTPGYDANGETLQQDALDHILVFARVSLHNQGTVPLFLHQIMTNATLADGPHTSYAATRTDYDRVFIAYPELAAQHTPGLPVDATIQPGQTIEGTFVSSFRITKKEWDARKDLNFTFAFQYQPSLTLTPQAAVTER
jgi:hypothetical protein